MVCSLFGQSNMIMNGTSLLDLAPLESMEEEKLRSNGVSYGLSEAGYDIRITQDIEFFPPDTLKLWKLFSDHRTQADVCPITKILMQRAHLGFCRVTHNNGKVEDIIGRFTLASAVEKFDMPSRLVGEVKDKSTWARKGLSVFNTVAEPKWKGYLTLELVFQGNEPVTIKAGSGIAQVLFALTSEEGDYGDGKYQNAEDHPQPAIEL